ncbi:MAG: hypothetical protein L0229_10935 [Blastocatellia bacterium]|nr:hypothetical protein [Blastocatellia bacterium]
MSDRKQISDSSRAKALDLWQAPDSAGEPLVCLATSFTFDATFFETECLGRFLQMDTHPQENESVGYLIEREEKLAQARVCVLADRRHAQSKESLRWDVLPVIVPRAVQHAKLSILCWADHIRVIIGSGNLTEPGYRKNLEVFGTLEASRSAGGQVEEILASIDFLEKVVAHALGDDARPGPRRRARESLDLLRDHTRSWPNAVGRASRVVPVFGGTGKPIFERVRAALPGGPPRNVKVISPFFDSDSKSEAVIAALIDSMAKRRPRRIDFYVAYEDLPDGRARVLAPRPLIEFARESCDVAVFKALIEEEGETRPLHAKMLAMNNEGWGVWLIGSSNFTRAGFGVTDSSANFEANLAYVARKGESESKSLDKVWPETAGEIEIASRNIVWESAFDAEGERGEIAALPASFREALFDAGNTPPRLILSLGEGLPRRWRITAAEGEKLLDSDSWPGGAGERMIEWENKRIPFVLGVEWESASGRHSADWPVNVVEPALLPPPEALRNLRLEDLIEILSSTRPLHVAVTHALKKRERRKSADIQLDPHKRVNTEEFLLRRTKRVAIALERLRERLERPVLNHDALYWRLQGPVGPKALAEAFLKEARTPDEARFLLAELALALGRVQPEQEARGGLSANEIRERIKSVIRDIEQRVASVAPGESQAINRYVLEAFKEANR